MIRVSLTPNERRLAVLVGEWRHAEAVKAGYADKHGCDMGLKAHIIGAGGEMACAKGLGVYWEPRVNTFKDADLSGPLGVGIQVRTRTRHDYELIVRDDDADGDDFVLVTVEAGEFRIVGHIYGWAAKNSDYRRAYGGREPAFFVPHAALASPDTLGG